MTWFVYVVQLTGGGLVVVQLQSGGLGLGGGGGGGLGLGEGTGGGGGLGLGGTGAGGGGVGLGGGTFTCASSLEIVAACSAMVDVKWAMDAACLEMVVLRAVIIMEAFVMTTVWFATTA
jgi:hypothetical protein